MYLESKNECEICPLNKTCNKFDSENCIIYKSIRNAFNVECLNNYDEGYRAGLQKAREMYDRNALLQTPDNLEFFANKAYECKKNIHPLIIISKELKPCPFCGSDNVEAKHDIHICDGDELATVFCYGCGKYFQGIGQGSTPEESVENAIKEWNRRANECDREALLKVADEMLDDTTSFDITNVPENIPAWIVFKWQERIRKALVVE